MLAKALAIARLGFYIAATLAVLAAGFAMLSIRKTSQAIQVSLSGTSALAAKLNTTLTSTNATLEIINRPCNAKVDGKLLPCGTLAQIGKSVVDVGDIAKTTQIQIKQSGALIQASTATLNGIGADVHTEMVSLTKTTDAATQLAQDGAATIRTASTTIQGMQPLVEASTATVTKAVTSLDRFNALLANADMLTILHNGAAISGTLGHMLATGDAVETKATANYLKPPSTNPWARGWDATKPWIPIVGQAAAKFAPVL